MPGFPIKHTVFPSKDGELNLYTHPSAKPGKRLIYVNGILNSPRDHQKTCIHLSELTGCEVVGVYNQSGTGMKSNSFPKWIAANVSNVVIDLVQCAQDYLDLGTAALGMGLPYLRNAASSSLFDLLLFKGATWPIKPICIVAHSQGNLITSNALFLYSALVHKYKVNPPAIHVFSVASPAPSWPTEAGFISVGNYWHRYDPVTGLSANRNKRGSSNGQGAMTTYSSSHGMDTYLQDTQLVNAIRIKAGTYVPPPAVKPKDPAVMFNKVPPMPFTRPIATLKRPPFGR
ncbi:MAG: hypothetical protein K2X72_09985 [Reyranella sp.]|nr:hypothetical protein [Reyranella sp.]